MYRTGLMTTWVLVLVASAPAADSERANIWKQGGAKASLVLPDRDPRAARLVQDTFDRYMHDFFGVNLASTSPAAKAGLRIVAGTPKNNAALAKLVGEGLQLTTNDLGDEGFQLLSQGTPEAGSIVIYGQTPRALKHGCQELIFFCIGATSSGGYADWPINVVRKPEVPYRGIYMLPCWSQHDSIASWQRVLRFNSELTLNRVWFWLDGFPVAGHPATSNIPNHPTDYDRTPLAVNENVQGLIDLANAEEMKFYIGGGWMSWHHEQVVGKDRQKARDFYFAYLRTFKGVGGFYFEPTGEGSETKDWRPECESLREMIGDVLQQNPNFEVAVAIGRFNNPGYLKVMSGLDPRRAYWWWCWGDPFADKALAIYPSVLAWHTVVRMSDIHGTIAAPSDAEKKLAGISTSYDPGMGFGNPWNGGSTLGGAPGPRNFDPYTMPYFSHEYRFRERCWNTRISDQEFTARLSRRLFDTDMPPDSIRHYLKLADLCFAPAKADDAALAELDAFVAGHADRGTPRNRDTLMRMREAVHGLRSTRPAAKPASK